MTSEDFAAFYARNKDPCLRALVASGTDRASAEEAAAEAFARAWAAWPKLQSHPAPAAWVMRTAMNHHVSRWRRSRREAALVAAGDDIGATWQVHTERDDLLRAVARLPVRQRQVVALRIFLDFDTARTGEVLGLSPGTVTAHLHRAMTALRAAITHDMEPCS